MERQGCPTPEKTAFRSRGAAERRLREIRITNAQAVAPGKTEPTRAYHCPCGAWHLATR